MQQVGKRGPPDTARDATRQRKQRRFYGEVMPTVMLPPEMAARVLDMLGNRDLCAARLAHRTFWPSASPQSLQRRRKQTWLRTSAERAAALGRVDVLRFLQRRRRISRNFCLWNEVGQRDDPDLVRLAVEWDPNMHRIDAAAEHAARRGHLAAFDVLFGATPLDAPRFMPAALSGGHHAIVRRLYAATPPDQRHEWLKHAIVMGLIDTVRLLVADDDRAPLGDVAALAARLGRIDILILIQELNPTFSWEGIHAHAVRGGSAAALYFMHDLGIGERPDLAALFSSAARRARADDVLFLGRRDPALSLRSALNDLSTVDRYSLGVGPTFAAICTLHAERGGDFALGTLFGKVAGPLDVRPFLRGPIRRQVLYERDVVAKVARLVPVVDQREFVNRATDSIYAFQKSRY
ncbi:hypothetical protein psal_cds_622 [Pandoravirus salinus]|uniref:Ankyrin repeat domain containing protein n=1 Tax=Pandoravirus salinus TaxID=1349410 RepID=S4VVZ4_9VIRU|nr:hypothetical protein psal_cds_622 [Pandoravirus salinus]AGO84508.2 hypothetical protein psal_cds_622 [Pandoravirus salinus]